LGALEVMVTATELAGFFAAHAIWCVSNGETLIPMLAFIDESGQRKMNRLAFDELVDAVENGQRQLAANEMNATDAVLLYDGRIPVAERKLDAIIIEIRTYVSPKSQAILAVPYSPKSFFRRFKVHKPKLLEWKDCEDFNMNSCLEAFFAGVAQHEKGGEVWNNGLDESK
jgi:hypothetical protein